MIPPTPDTPTTPGSAPLSPAVTLVEGVSSYPQRFSPARKWCLLFLFCLAQWLDAINNSVLFSAIPDLEVTLDMTESQSAWIMSAFQLTFASFLLMSGKISDLYNPKVSFICGVMTLGLISVGAGFANDKVILITLRALMGVCAALTIPSALTLLVNVFTEPTEQARALGLFGGIGGVGNVLGLIIGAIFTQYLSYRWVFWFIAIVSLPLGFSCVFLIPEQHSPWAGHDRWLRFKKLDVIGVSMLTVALILFIFALTEGANGSWVAAGVLAPLIISIFLIGGFIWWENFIPSADAAVPPRTWFLPNFSVLFGIALLPYFWWTAVFMVFTTLWQSVYGWAAIDSAIHMIPIGAISLAMSFTGPLSRKINPKWLMLTGLVGMIIATVLLALADAPGKYWGYVFPAFLLGSGGASLVYTHTNIAIFRTSPASMAGTVGAIFNGGLQLGSAVGIAAVTSIESSIEKTHGGFTQYAGRAATFWFLLGIVVLEAAAIVVFYRRNVPEMEDERLEDKLEKKGFGPEVHVSKTIEVKEVKEADWEIGGQMNGLPALNMNQSSNDSDERMAIHEANREVHADGANIV